ncbi:unnamed protein product [Brassica oleracea var. botrytis]
MHDHLKGNLITPAMELCQGAVMHRRRCQRTVAFSLRSSRIRTKRCRP